MADEKKGPRETAAGLQRGEEDPSQPIANQGEQAKAEKAMDMHRDDRTQDDASVRAKNSRHDKMTADKWNQ